MSTPTTSEHFLQEYKVNSVLTKKPETSVSVGRLIHRVLGDVNAA
ncbi:MAG: hypothetical protein QXO64_05670 [Thermofilaceae archaeon]